MMFSRRIFSITSVLLAGTGAAYSLSKPCQSALAQIVSSPEASCLNVGGLVSIFATPQNQSIIQPINNWLTGACGSKACSNQTLSNLVANVTVGCQQDLQDAGITPNQDQLTAYVQQWYPTLLDEFCLKQTSNNSFCVTSLLTDIQNIDGTISLNAIANYSDILYAPPSLPTYITCSDCVKQMYNIVKQQQPDAAQSTNLTSTLQQACGANFVDGQTPSQIIEATGAAASSTSGSTASSGERLSFNVLYGAVMSSLMAVSAIFVVLA